MARITKEPSVRRNEILNIAMELFYEKGYDRTSITDIANKMKVAQGLCYRYFKSKEEIFQYALEESADRSIEKLMRILSDNNKNVLEKLNETSLLGILGNDENSYNKFYHKNENSKIHDELLLKICEKLIPILLKEVEKWNKTEKNINITESMVYFCLYGQLGILKLDSLTHEEKLKEIELLINKIIGI
ncbi:TetR/AcrR family transcriptional regulator [Clostridium beijerinckii]|uniref:TetR/AcrR family transcriptional regulator n=1 Tax=Clostridium beijerinckii TaxID=1520 RepID=UPI000AD6F93B|nr:TetR/AcrR family transcriptional regulator [Clostridium beijerinckii]